MNMIDVARRCRNMWCYSVAIMYEWRKQRITGWMQVYEQLCRSVGR